METNISGWKYYQPGYVHEEFVPYLRKIITDKSGNKISINTWKHQGNPELIDDALVRKNWGLRFQKQFTQDPCPLGWTDGPDGYCFRNSIAEPKNERIFYTDKAFIAKRQYWDGYAEEVTNPGPLEPLVSQETDMRSVNPYTGLYTIYYPGVDSTANTRYAKPIRPRDVQYDDSWSLPQRRRYAALPTKDSYL